MADLIISREDARAQGLTHFFTGENCRNGHRSRRLVSNGLCFECRCAVERRFRERHPDRVAANRRAQYQKLNPDYFAAYYERNAEKRKTQARAWYEANKKRALKVQREWVERHPDRVREMGRMSARKRRAIKAAVGGSHTQADLDRIFKQQRGKCALCKCSLEKAIKELDHIIPISRGGDNGPGNLQWLCRPCNRSKSNKDPVQFAQERGLLL